ncbi:hypothetical protein BDR05DRAFT_949751 [Suillus weaverae]|nr:hypothetical protein BDR05DRAFT_949751 [Suillus weaverae]
MTYSPYVGANVLTIHAMLTYSLSSSDYCTALTSSSIDIYLSKYSTRNPVFLVLQEFKPVVIDTILSYKLSLVQAGTMLTLSINGQETDMPNQCYDVLKLLLHHICIYQYTCITLHGLQNSPANEHTTYISIIYYYCEVLFAFCKEAQDDIDFKNKVYLPVKTFSIVSYHKSYCKGQDMCGDTTANHIVSVLDMIENIVGLYRSSASVGTLVKVKKAVRFTSDIEEQRE